MKSLGLSRSNPGAWLCFSHLCLSVLVFFWGGVFVLFCIFLSMLICGFWVHQKKISQQIPQCEKLLNVIKRGRADSDVCLCETMREVEVSFTVVKRLQADCAVAETRLMFPSLRGLTSKEQVVRWSQSCSLPVWLNCGNVSSILTWCVPEAELHTLVLQLQTGRVVLEHCGDVSLEMDDEEKGVLITNLHGIIVS